MRSTRASITGVASFLPEDTLTNQELEQRLDTTNEWITERCGVQERRIMRDPEKASVFMGAEAATKTLLSRNIDPLDIELVICATVTPDHQFPATANIISAMIGAKNAWSFDLMGACSGFIYALNVARQFIETGTHKTVLVIGAEKMSTIIDPQCRQTRILFGDGAGAVLLEPNTEGDGIIDARMHSDGAGYPYLHQYAGGSLHPASEESVRLRQHFVHMNGKAVFKVAVEKMAEVSEEIMKRNGLTAADIAYFVPHQANKRIIEATAHHMKLSEEKVMVNIHKYGNTTAATLPICLAEWENRLKRGDNLILTTFGAGFTWGSMYLKWAYTKGA